MKLWKLTRTDQVDYDQYDSFVVRARSELEARRLVTQFAPSSTWTKDENVTCVELLKNGSTMIILAKFIRG